MSPCPDRLGRRRETADVLYTLTGFLTFDVLAEETRSPQDIWEFEEAVTNYVVREGPKSTPATQVPLVRRLARAALGLDQR
jgi:hypothetical protein